MNGRSVFLGIASAVTSFLLAGAVTIVAIGDRWGDSPGVGIVAVFVGFVTALVVGLVVVAAGDRLTGTAASLLVAYATFGVAFLGIAALQYSNVPLSEELFPFPAHFATSVVVAVIAGALDHYRDGSAARIRTA